MIEPAFDEVAKQWHEQQASALPVLSPAAQKVANVQARLLAALDTAALMEHRLAFMRRPENRDQQHLIFGCAEAFRNSQTECQRLLGEYMKVSLALAIEQGQVEA